MWGKIYFLIIQRQASKQKIRTSHKNTTKVKDNKIQKLKALRKLLKVSETKPQERAEALLETNYVPKLC